MEEDRLDTLEEQVRAHTEDSDAPCLSRESFLRTAAEGNVMWEEIPDELRTDPSFVRDIVAFSDSRGALAFEVFEHFPLLREERTLWESFICCLDHFDNDATHLIIDKYAPNHIRSDRDLMMVACYKDYRTLAIIDATLRHDRDFVHAVLEKDARALECVPISFLQQYPAYATTWLEPFAKNPPNWNSTHLSRRFREAGMWARTETVVAWFKAGLPYDRFEMPRTWMEDRDILLLIASICPEETVFYSFASASPTFQNDKDFMMRVLERAPTLFNWASDELRQDFQIMLIAFTGLGTDCVCYSSLITFESEVREQLKLHDTFVSTFLFGINQKAGPRCRLRLLDQGKETSLHYKRLVAEYLGIPTGRQLRLLRRAMAILKQLSVPPTRRWRSSQVIELLKKPPVWRYQT